MSLAAFGLPSLVIACFIAASLSGSATRDAQFRPTLLESVRSGQLRWRLPALQHIVRCSFGDLERRTDTELEEPVFLTLQGRPGSRP